MNDKKRADQALVERGLCESREKAQALIMAGVVYIDEVKVEKPSVQVKPEDNLIVRGKANPFVSRGGLKLEKALKSFQADVSGVVAMDIGAATGGFTDVLLKGGAAHVYAIDVGYGQLDLRLRQDERVTVMERTNARHLTRESFDKQPTLTVMDVSFISIKLILPVAAEIMGDAGRFYTLIKPQFEAGRENVGKKGVVRDPDQHCQVIKSIRDFVTTFGWQMQALDYSPITGPEGNIEFLASIAKEDHNIQPPDDGKIAALVDAAHIALKKNHIG